MWQNALDVNKETGSPQTILNMIAENLRKVTENSCVLDEI
jgi:hypothetical protein